MVRKKSYRKTIDGIQNSLLFFLTKERFKSIFLLSRFAYPIKTIYAFVKVLFNSEQLLKILKDVLFRNTRELTFFMEFKQSEMFPINIF